MPTICPHCGHSFLNMLGLRKRCPKCGRYLDETPDTNYDAIHRRREEEQRRPDDDATTTYAAATSIYPSSPIESIGVGSIMGAGAAAPVESAPSHSDHGSYSAPDSSPSYDSSATSGGSDSSGGSFGGGGE